VGLSPVPFLLFLLFLLFLAPLSDGTSKSSSLPSDIILDAQKRI
jgi:hypothetical protein